MVLPQLGCRAEGHTLLEGVVRNLPEEEVVRSLPVKGVMRSLLAVVLHTWAEGVGVGGARQLAVLAHELVQSLLAVVAVQPVA